MKDTERGVPSASPVASNPSPRASTVRGIRPDGVSTPSRVRRQASGSVPAWAAAAARILPAKAEAARALIGLAGDHGSGAAIGAGIVGHRIGVGLDQADAVRRGAERLRRDLSVHRAGAVAELGGADRQRIAPVRFEADAGMGEVAARRDRVDHAHGHPLPDQPFGTGRRLAGIVGQGALGEVED